MTRDEQRKAKVLEEAHRISADAGDLLSRIDQCLAETAGRDSDIRSNEGASHHGARAGSG